MVLMFLCGCFKYAERTYCLYCASPSVLVSRSVRSLSHTLRVLQRDRRNGIAEPRYHWTAGFYNWEKRPSRDGARSQMSETFDMMLNGRRSWQSIRGRGITGSDITSVDALHNTVPSILLADDDLPAMLRDLISCLMQAATGPMSTWEYAWRIATSASTLKTHFEKLSTLFLGIWCIGYASLTF